MTADVERFRGLIARRLGLALGESRRASLDALLARRAARVNRAPAAYLESLERETGIGGELGDLATELTVPETYFFRDPDQYRALAEIVLPARVQARGPAPALRILSAGCASGEEAYSLAMLLRERARDLRCAAQVLGVDANASMIAKAEEARYTAWSLRGTAPEMQRRWFRKDGREFVLADEVRAMVQFSRWNLADEATPWAPGTFDVVFCRNVLMYFTPDAARAVVARLAGALAPGGYLFVGHAEPLRGMSDAFDLCHTHGTFYYRLAGAEPASVRAAEPAFDAASWPEIIRSAAERVAALAQERVSERAPEPVFPRAARLERALLLTDEGRFADAERACLELLSVDARDGAAHYILALCRAGSGDDEQAARYGHLACQLEPSFAMPRVHVGLLALKQGRIAAARNDLERAIALLERDEPSRVAFFGGGFSRDALVALCRSHLARCGART